MKVSYRWLQSYFKDMLPPPEKIGEVLTHLSFELEGLEKAGEDTMIDVKVLPDRACYALSHRGIAYEVAAGLGLETIAPQWQTPTAASGAMLPEVRVETPELCTFFAGRRIAGLKNGSSPEWMREMLGTIGQRSINAIVDVTNFVMFDIGRPLHAFDAHKVKGSIVVRFAKDGEVVKTLDKKEVKLDPSILVLADSEGPLALAGIKGGNRADVTEETTEVILEAANWDPMYIRRTSQRVGIKTDASKRFENCVPLAYAVEGVDHAASLIATIAGSPQTKVSEFLSVGDAKQEVRTISVPANMVASRLGFPVALSEALGALKRLGIDGAEKNGLLQLTIPDFRLDLSIPEDIVEEVGRVLGYDKIPTTLPPKADVAEIPNSFYIEWKIREALTRAGFSDVMTSSFSAKGNVQVLKPLAEDKRYARANLRGNFEKALKMNSLNAPFLGVEIIKIFEIGQVFKKEGERTALAIGVAGPKKKTAGVLEGAMQTVAEALGLDLQGEIKDGIFEVEIETGRLQGSTLYTRSNLVGRWDISLPEVKTEKYTHFSLYPFVVRDIALFVPEGTQPGMVAEVIRKNAGELVVRGPELFDEFAKDGRKSLAFRLVFQSFERTLSDEEVNTNMERVAAAAKEHSWEVR